MFTEIQPKSTDFALKSERLIFNDLAKNYQKFLPNAKFGSVRPKGVCVCVFACIYVFFFFFSFFLFFFFSFLFFLFYSWPDLNLRLYPHNAPNLLASSWKGFTGDDMFGGQG